MNNSVINEAKELAINSIKLFLTKLNINPNELEEIYNIDIKVNQLAKDEGEYDHKNNTIVLSEDYITDTIDKMEQDNENRNRYIVDVARTIAHEMMHANLDRIKIVKPNLNDSLETFMYQFGFEEAITSVLSTIIIGTRKDLKLDINPLIERIRNNDAYAKYEKVGALIFNNLGADMLKTCMTANYDEYLSGEYGDDYSKIVTSVGQLYSLELIKESYIEDSIEESKNNSQQEKIQKYTENILNTYRKRL